MIKLVSGYEEEKIEKNKWRMEEIFESIHGLKS
jgi:hypothetical protein